MIIDSSTLELTGAITVISGDKIIPQVREIDTDQRTVTVLVDRENLQAMFDEINVWEPAHIVNTVQIKVGSLEIQTEKCGNHVLW